MSDYVTRDLTAEESERLVRRLTVALGAVQAQSALRVIAESGAGVFMAQPVLSAAVDIHPTESV